MEIPIQRLMESYNKTTKRDFIGMIKLKGELIEHVDNVIPLLDNRFAERALLQFNDLFYITFIISDNFADIVYREDIKAYDLEDEAREYYYDLPNILNDEENE